ncbi:MAG: hypothetical protein ACOYM3_11225 [Terrimicrobiaceae bacterium]
MKHTVTALLLATAVIALLTSPKLQSAALLASAISFEEGNLKLFNGANVVNGGLEIDTTAETGEFHEFLHTVPEDGTFEAAKNYRISFDYTINKIGDEKTGFFHQFRSASNPDVNRSYEWSAPAGSKGHKEFGIHSEVADYQLVCGVHYQGAIRIENLRIEEVELPPGIPFSGPVTNDARFRFENGAEVVDGGIEVDTTRDDIDFHEYFATVPANVKFVPGKRYSVSYDYTVRKLGDDSTRFYHFARHIKENGLKDLGVEYWTDTEGGAGHKEVEFTADPQSEAYKVVLGVRFKGAVRIENLKIAEVE